MNIEQIVAIVSPETAAERAAQAEFNTKLISNLDQKIAEAEAKLAELQATKKSLSTVPEFPNWARTFDKLCRVYDLEREGSIVRISTDGDPSYFNGEKFWCELIEAIQMAGVKLVIHYDGDENHMYGSPVQFLPWDGTSPFEFEYGNIPIVEGILEWKPLP